MSTVMLPGALALGLAFCLHASPADAIPRTFVSGIGSGSACTRAAPCATFQAAHDATDPLGEITCLDAGNFGSVVVTKAITIDCGGTMGTISSPAVPGVNIATDGVVVRLRNLTIHGGGSSTQYGVRLTAGSVLFVENCLITTFSNLTPFGISFAPSSGGTSKLFVKDTTISNSGVGALGGGIEIAPTGSTSVRAALERVRIQNNVQGIVASAPASKDTIVELRDSVVSASVSHGLNATGSAGFAAFVVDRSALMFNGGNAIFANGVSAAVHIGHSTVIGNTAGLVTSGGGKIFSYQNNQATGNNTDGAPTNVLTVK